ncbi:MAG: LamG domain-containing protein, partial [Pirellulaceae bacterium]|nr:LamG domain-containing protein [Pirellulaceae bacterium]
MKDSSIFLTPCLLFAVTVGLLSSSLSAQSKPASSDRASTASSRTQDGLLVLYDFADADGDWVRDRSGSGQPLDLKITKRDQVKRAAGSLTVTGNTVIRCEQPATKIFRAVKQSGEITIEVWVRPDRTDQSGPARIVTFSQNTNVRNFTLGQDGDHYDVRFRTNKTDSNGIPSLASPGGTLKTELTHVVYVRKKNGDTQLSVNGKRVARGKTTGNVSPWNDGFSLALANEVTGERPFLGSYHLVAIYGRALDDAAIGKNFDAGVGSISAAKVTKTDTPTTPGVSLSASGGERVTNGLQLLFDFADASGNLVRDRSGAGQGGDLKISDPKSIRRMPGSLEIRTKAVIRSDKAPQRVVDAIKRSGELSMEAWIRPANLKQAGPARIFTLSKDSINRNFTLGQDGDKFEVRLRAASTSANG